MKRFLARVAARLFDMTSHARLGVLAGVIGAALVAGCAGTRGGPIAYDVKNFGTPDSPTTTALEADYKISPMDTLRISVFQVPDMSGDFEVDLLGNVSMPLVGMVKAADLTPTQFDEELTAKLGEKYLQNPDVSVQLKASARRNVTVDGAVAAPGMYPVNGPTTLIQAIALARGVTQDSNPKRVAIFRQIQGKRMAAAFDLTAIRKGQMQDPAVYSGDVIVVGGNGIKALQNQILMSLPIVGLFNPIIY